MRTGVPCNENRVFPVRIGSQGVPCELYNTGLGITVYLIHCLFLKRWKFKEFKLKKFILKKFKLKKFKLKKFKLKTFKFRCFKL